MSKFDESLTRAAEKLERAADKMSDRGDGRNALGQFVGGGGGGGGGALASMVGGLSGGRSFFGATGPAGAALGAAAAGAELISAGARALTPAASAYALTGTSQGFASGVTSSLLDSVGGTGLGGLLLGGSGIAAARNTNKAAGDATADITSSLAAIGVQVNDKDRQELFDVNQAIEGRRNAERGKVQAIADSAKELGDAKPAGAGSTFDGILAALTRLESFITTNWPR